MYWVKHWWPAHIEKRRLFVLSRNWTQNIGYDFQKRWGALEYQCWARQVKYESDEITAIKYTLKIETWNWSLFELPNENSSNKK